MRGKEEDEDEESVIFATSPLEMAARNLAASVGFRTVANTLNPARNK
jgi:hypothetical protein